MFLVCIFHESADIFDLVDNLLHVLVRFVPEGNGRNSSGLYSLSSSMEAGGSLPGPYDDKIHFGRPLSEDKSVLTSTLFIRQESCRPLLPTPPRRLPPPLLKAPNLFGLLKPPPGCSFLQLLPNLQFPCRKNLQTTIAIQSKPARVGIWPTSTTRSKKLLIAVCYLCNLMFESRLPMLASLK